MLGGLPGLGIRIIFAVFHCLGSLPLRQHSLKYAVRAQMVSSPMFFNVLFDILLGPAADLLLSFCSYSYICAMNVPKTFI